MSEDSQHLTDQQIRDLIAQSIIPEDIQNATTDEGIGTLLDSETPSEIDATRIIAQASDWRKPGASAAPNANRKWVPVLLTSGIAAAVIGGLILVNHQRSSSGGNVASAPMKMEGTALEIETATPLGKTVAPTEKSIQNLPMAGAAPAIKPTKTLGKKAAPTIAADPTTVSPKARLAASAPPADITGARGARMATKTKKASESVTQTLDAPASSQRVKVPMTHRAITPAKKGKTVNPLAEAEALEAIGEKAAARAVYEKLLESLTPEQKTLREKILQRLKNLETVK